MTAHAELRPLRPEDLERVVAIDQALSGRSRHGFYSKRLPLVGGGPDGIIGLAAERDGRVDGFVLANVLDGEFGGTAPVGVLCAIGVDRAAARHGIGSALARALEEALRARGVREIRAEVSWTAHDLVALLAARGYRLSRRLVLARPVGDLVEEPPADGTEEFPALPVAVRSMVEADLPAIVQVDRSITARDRAAYYQRKAAEVLRQSGVRVSLVAEVGRDFAGFLMARMDFGESGRTEPTAVLDSVGVHRAFADRGVGRALLRQLLLNLQSLRVEQLVTQVEWDDFVLLRFLRRTGFGRAQRLAFEKSIP